MRLLLDTHAFIWMHASPGLLSATASAAITDTGNTLFLSVASVWEMQIKQQLRKLDLHAPLGDIIEEERVKNDFRILPIDVADILALGELPHHHRDPFDRLIIAQARRRGLHFVTNDPEISRYEVPTLW